jgi:hypothetical protein
VRPGGVRAGQHELTTVQDFRVAQVLNEPVAPVVWGDQVVDDHVRLMDSNEVGEAGIAALDGVDVRRDHDEAGLLEGQAQHLDNIVVAVEDGDDRYGPAGRHENHWSKRRAAVRPGYIIRVFFDFVRKATMPWIQVYDPLGNPWLSTAAAALPIVLLLVTLGVLEWKAHWAALTGLVSALAVSTIVYGMPVPTAAATAVYGAAYGLLPIGWIIVNAVFLYNLTVETGQFGIVKSSVANLSADRRIQALLIAFSFGAFIEGASGFGTPVAICSALLMGLGFTPLYAAGLALIANTAPVAFGAIGTPIANPDARGRHRIAGHDAQCDGRSATPLRVGDRAGVAGGNDERMERPCGRLARGARVGRRVRHRSIWLEQLRRARAR